MEQLIIEKYNYPTVHKVDILSRTLVLTFDAFDDGRIASINHVCC